MALIIGTADSEWIDGTGADDTIQGLAGDDTLVGYQGNDLLEAGEGNDVLSGGPGDDTLDGGAGVDTAAYTSAPGAVSVDLAAGTASGGAGNDVLIGIENITGSAFNDTLIGDAGTNLIRGLDGDDLLGARGGGDTLDGGAGFDFVSVVQAPVGVDVDLAAGQYLSRTEGAIPVTLISIEGVYGSLYADLLRGDGNTNVLRGNGGDDTLDGGAGFDYADYATAAGAVQVDLAAGTATGADGNDTLISIEGVRGSSHDDLLVGDDGANILRGRGGNDTLDGGAGIDTADYRGSGSSGVTVDLSQGTATGGAGNDTLISIENVIGSEFDDLLIGDDGPNSLVGGLGNDELRGGAGADTLQGGDGDDALDGGEGLDVAEYRGAVEDFSVSVGEGGAVSIADEAGSEGSDLLTGVERAVFADGAALAFDIDGTGGMAYRIYKAAFDREPDLAGLGYWIAKLDEGASALDMSVGFLGSEEFQTLYGPGLTNEEYTQALYQNVLDRDPDANGYAYWNAVLNGEEWNGSYYGQTTREQMLVDFSESVENRENVLPLIENGIRFDLWEG